MIDEAARIALNKLKGDFPDLEDEAKHFYVCPSCRQAVDMRRLGDVLHHEDEGHERIPVQ